MDTSGDGQLTSMQADRDTKTISFERSLTTSRREAFDAWTQPRILERWWDPSGMKLAVCEIDLREGGEFKFQGASGDGHPFTGKYLEIAPPERLVFEALGAIGTVLFTESRSAILMQVTITCGSEAHFDQFIQMGVAEGTAKTLDNLTALFASV